MDKDRMLREIAVRSGYSEEETRQFYAALVDVFTEGREKASLLHTFQAEQGVRAEITFRYKDRRDRRMGTNLPAAGMGGDFR